MEKLDFLYNDIFEIIDRLAINELVLSNLDEPEEYKPELFTLISTFTKDYDEFIFSQTPCSRCPVTQERVVIKIYEFKCNRIKFYSIGLKEEIPDYVFRTLASASLSWNLRVKHYLIKVYHSESIKLTMISVLSIILLIGFTTNFKDSIPSMIIFSFIIIFCTAITLKADSFSEFYMDLISRKDYKGKLSFLESLFMKITKYFIKESDEDFVINRVKDSNAFDNVDSIYLDYYRNFRLNLVSLKFNLKQISNKDFVDKAREGLDLAVDLAKYLELHKDKIVYSRDFFKTTEKLLRLSRILLENQEYTSGKFDEINLKSVELAEELIKILTYSFQVILDYDKDELLAKLKVMKMDTKDYLSYLELKGDKFNNEQ